MSYTLSGGRIDAPKSAPFPCQFCSANLDRLGVHEREQHYEKHLTDAPIASSSTSSRKNPVDKNSATDSKSSKKFNWKPDWLSVPKGQDEFWYPAQDLPPPHNYTPGLIPLLKTHLNKSHLKGNTRRAVLCYERAVLVTREVWDAGWGCGYRNFLMACTTLMDQHIQPMYFPLLDHPIPPSVRNLQDWIEAAWREGFDPEGAEQLRPLAGSKKWIGTSDVQVAFTSRGIPAKLVDFDLKKNARGANLLTDWVVEYFSQSQGSVNTSNVVKNVRAKTINEVLFGASPVTITARMPLILQHAGHSRTIVGYEVSKTGLVNLLVFDPGRVPRKCLRKAGIEVFSAMNARRNAHASPTAETSNSPSTKRPGTPVSLDTLPLKRSRVDVQYDDAQPENGTEVIVVDDSDDENVPASENTSPDRKKKKTEPQKLATSDVLQFFRLDPKTLEKKKAYQILYFPMSPPMDDAEKRRARVVYGEKIS
ncbi:peptidase family C78-domain-containing protein [Favolaschia claudopus]|uniref:Peptidase family C78-domain-containing protein n=1 Tax=Favolaschia claudopus TaxID=2862362 RepID=A0AAW0BCK6_9AGAR